MSTSHKNSHKKHNTNKKFNQKGYHPVNRGNSYHPSKNSKKSMKTPAVNNNFFGGNLANNMKFGGSDHNLSGYVKREMIVEDRYGNKQTAREKQFFNSGKNLGRVKIQDDDETDF